jgi:hypothetical protein
MDVTTFRRYLQPSPTLRWHPWAPLATLLLAFAFVFGAGVALGMKYQKRHDRPSRYSAAMFEVMTQQEAQVRPTALVIRRAQHIDNAVAQWVYDNERKGWLDRAIDAVQARLRPQRVPAIDMDDALHDSMRRAAQWRLANLSGGAPAWQQTSIYCDEWKPSFDDVTAIYQRYAEAYTKLLGREVTARQLAPAVPGGKCNERGTR